MTLQEQLNQAKAVKNEIAQCGTEKKREALLQMAQALEAHMDAILQANQEDLDAAAGSLSTVMVDRLRLDADRIQAMAQGIRSVATLDDPVGVVRRQTVRPNGLDIRQVSCPMGVIAVIYESRPNVTSDAAALTLMAGSSCILRCGKEAHRSASAICQALQEGLVQAGLPGQLVSLVADTSRAGAQALMTATDYVDLLIPRGGKGLIDACLQGAKVPCIQTGAGICHIYVDQSADVDMALDIVDNAKTSRPSVCNAAEVCLVHRDVAPQFLPRLSQRFAGRVELRLDEAAQAIIPGTPAGPLDFDTEFLDYKMAIRVVPDITAAIAHIAAHSTGHSESIITRSADAMAQFTSQVDSAAVYVNASTRFTDGGEFGLGCEMGISTQRLHARGPMGLEALTTYKYVIFGNGQIR